MEIAIVRARIPEDARALAKFDRETFPRKEDHSTSSYFLQRGLRTFWLLRNGRRVGVCCLKHHATFTPKMDALSRREQGTLYITSISVLPQLRRSGLGTILTAWQVAYARAHGLTKIVSNARAGNDMSIHLHLKSGFVITARSAKCYPNGEDTVILELDLTHSLPIT